MNYDWPKLKLNSKENKVLVLAPHIDDEVIGCGGIISMYAEYKKEVYVVFMTDGTKGTVGNKTDPELRQRRKAEAEKVKNILGLTEIYFLNLKDRGDWDTNKAVNDLADIFSDIGPDAVFVTPPNDLHEDHRKTNSILKELVKSGIYKGTVYEYEVWTPINPNRIVNITGNFKKKIRAIEICESQLSVMDYKKMISGMAEYRACFIPIKGIDYAEAFLEMSCEEFLEQ